MKRTLRSFTVEIRSSGRKEPPAPHRTLQTATSPAKAAFVPEEEAPKPWKTARILPTLEISEPSASQTLEASADTMPLDQEHPTQQWAEDVMAAEPDEIAFDLVLEDDELTPDTTPVTLLRHHWARNEELPRQAFRRSERWKHRLPKVMQQRAGKRAQ
ncbi:hypothetical protein [Lichenifustis flavocetrariae]|uniref:Uncharacterized protein n=1 Tax=Lichenifustis flavocetrariae TaxID=2949735 RepID=A0AA41ZAV3_9HYPH|nr:hypothetical protein [Lichenifustis flavocetrariae]MCW6512507.1 hypothetical protein [Lichenifustis flavocetrariae]